MNNMRNRLDYGCKGTKKSEKRRVKSEKIAAASVVFDLYQNDWEVVSTGLRNRCCCTCH